MIMGETAMDSESVVMFANWMLLVITVGYWIFAIVYGTLFKWYNNEVGRVQLPSKVLMACILTQVTASAFNQSDYAYRNEIRFALYLLGAIIVIVVNFVILRMAWRKYSTKRKIKRGEIVCPSDRARVEGTTPHEL